MKINNFHSNVRFCTVILARKFVKCLRDGYFSEKTSEKKFVHIFWTSTVFGDHSNITKLRGRQFCYFPNKIAYFFFIKVLHRGEGYKKGRFLRYVISEWSLMTIAFMA